MKLILSSKVFLGLLVLRSAANNYEYDEYDYAAAEAMEGFNEEAFDIEAKALRGSMGGILEEEEQGSYDFDYEDDEGSEYEEPDIMEYYDYDEVDEDEDETYDEYDVGQRAKRKEKVLNLYSAEGFEYVGKEEVGEYEEKNLESTEIDYSSVGSLNFDGPVSRVTTKGDVYTAPSSAGLMANDKDEVKKNLKPIRDQKKKSSLPPNFEKEDDGVEGESVIGRDTRFQVPYDWRVAGWQFWRVVQLSNGCSGTIVGWNKVLTSAHCVYSRSRKQWVVPSRVTPGRNGSDRWGSWNVRHATILTAYINDSSNYPKYDYAILTTKDDNWTRKHIGQYMGYFPMQDVSCSVLDQETYKKRIVGYPIDKPSGTMWDAGQCDAWHYTCGSKMVYHKCDTWQSGSGMLLFYSNWSIRVIGVHGYGTSDRTNGWNSGPAFDGGIASMLRTW